MNSKVVLMAFGGRSAEHDISVLTALQAFEALDRDQWTPLLFYVDPRGGCWTGPGLASKDVCRTLRDGGVEDVNGVRKAMIVSVGNSLSVRSTSTGGRLFSKASFDDQVPDVVFPLFHGTFGEDGAFQGLVTWSGTPMAGSGCAASALGMDKAATKTIARAHAIPVLDWHLVDLNTFEASRVDALESELLATLKTYPLIVKPNTLGSSVGVHSVNDRQQLLAALLDVRGRDDSAIVEPFLVRCREINIAVMSHPAVQVSAIEEPQRSADEEFLTYAQKYTRGGKNKLRVSGGMATLPRKINPDWITAKQRETVSAAASGLFRAIGCRGVARIDFLVAKDGEIYLNEINTIPGSLAHFLWPKAEKPLTYTKMLDLILEEALAVANRQSGLTRFDAALQVL